MAVRLCKQGHFSEHGAQNKCLECSRNRARLRRTENNAHVNKVNRAYYAANRTLRCEQGRSYYRANFKKTMLQNAQKRARQGGYPCTITVDDIVIPEYCPLLGIKLHSGRPLAASPSLDKIKPELGYVPGNVWVISHRANALKGDASLEELKMLVANLEKRCTVTSVPTTKLESYPWQ